MSRFFRKYFILSILSFLFSEKGTAQILDNANLNLSAGGYINDAIYDPYHDCYIVVGNFTTINGKNRKNIAFLNKTTLAVLSTSNVLPMDSIGGMNGEIRTVAITSNNTLPSSTISLYIGGNFSTITKSSTNYTRNGIAKFTCTKNMLFPFPPAGNFSISAWNPDLDMTPLLTGANADGVNDILISHDSIIFCGRFGEVNNSTTSDLRDGVAAYTLSGTLLNYPAFNTSTYFENNFFKLEKAGPYLFIGGSMNGGGYNMGELLKLDVGGNIIAGFSLPFSEVVTCVFDFSLFEDSLILVATDYNAESFQPDMLLVCRQSNGTFKTNHSFYNTGVFGGTFGVSGLAVHNDVSFITSSSAGYYTVSYESIGAGPPVSAPNWNGIVNANLTTSPYGKIHVAGSKLFISAPNLSTMNGQSRLRLGAYCIEPDKAENFDNFDTTVCPDDTVLYSIPLVGFADGYRWEYSGNGANLNGNMGADTLVDIALTTGNSLNVEFTPEFTPGVLSVTPYSLCNGSTKIFSNTISINIHSNPLPHVNAGNDTAINCYDTLGIVLYGYSDSLVDTYTWVYPSSLDNVDGQNDSVETDGFYVFKVVNPLGCPNFDTVYVSMDTIAPGLTLPTPPYELTCADPVQSFMGSSPTPNTVFEWYQDTTYFPNPVSVGAVGAYYLVVTDTLNGCDSEEGIFVSPNFDPPNIQIVGYSPLNIAQPVDTLTCFQNSLSMTCYSDTVNTTTSWINSDTTIFYGDNINITAGGNYFIFATNNTNGCTNSVGINIATDLNPPGVNAPLNGLLNCSTDSLILDGDSLSTGATLEWSGLLISPSSDPLTIYDAGTYYLSATSPSNGCSSVDSVIISQDNSITVFAGNDTLVCDKALIPFNATYVGTISGINYVWSNGNTSQSSSYTAGLDPYAAVTVSGDGGCVGTDTVYLDIPPVPVITFEGFKPCGDGPSGQIVATPVSGIEPFTYSIDDGINFQSSPVFGGLYIGTYPILVHDSLNCEYDFSATIDESSALPTPAFLFSTYNYETDTVVIIDVSNPPTDSTLWVFPTELIVLDNNPISPMILLPDTGAFSITMQAYYGDCLVEVTKMIYASPFDSLAATQYNLNGIKSIELYPNPTTGNFTVAVEFYTSQRSAVVVQDMIGNTYVFEEYDESLIITQDIFLDNSVLDGTYVMKIVSEFDSGTITFILAR